MREDRSYPKDLSTACLSLCARASHISARTFVRRPPKCT